MKIGIDLDEVVVEFVRGYLEIYNKKYGKNASFEDIFSYNLWESLNITKEQAIQIADEFYESELFGSIGIIEGAVEAINKLGEKNEIFFITSRPNHIKNKTEAFIKKYFSNIKSDLIYSGDFWGGKKKAEICCDLGIDFMVEDHEKYSNEIANCGIKVFLLSKPWNNNTEGSDNLVRVKNWNEILEKLGGKLE